MSLLRPGVIKQTQTNQPIIYAYISLQIIWIRFVINLGRFDFGHFDSGTFWLGMFWLWDVLTWDVLTLGRFDFGTLTWDVLTLGHFDYGTFCHWDVLTLGRFDRYPVIHDTECPYWDQVSLNNTNCLFSTSSSQNVAAGFSQMNLYWWAALALSLYVH